MESKEPVVLVVLVETEKLRWFVAGIDLEGNDIPLLCSEEGNLSPYLTAEGEEKVSFLRHRFSGVLQRGGDRLWGRKKKPCQIVFVLDGHFIEAPAELTQRVAEHMAEWLWNPPVVFYCCEHGFAAGESDMNHLSGNIDASFHDALQKGLMKLATAIQHTEDWELSPVKVKA